MKSIPTLTASILIAAAASAQVTHIPSYTFNGDSSEDQFGWSVSSAGDVNADGYADFIVGAPSDDNNGFSSGSASVFSGLDGTIIHTFNGEFPNRKLGWSVSGAGDVNNDGFDDLIVGMPAVLATTGSARVFSGATGAILYTFNGDSNGDGFGRTVSGAGDVNNDGFDDFIVGAPGDDNSGNASGSARVFSGTDGSILYTFNGDAPMDSFGFSVSGAGDVNNDGFDDLFVGSSYSDENGEDAGSARVFSGANGSILHTFLGDSPFDRFGTSVSDAGDVNNDGFADLIVGAFLDDNIAEDSGSATVFSGATGAILYTFNGAAIRDYFGVSVSSAGDVNMDNFDDFIIGVPGNDNNGIDCGSATVFSGATGAILYTFNGDSVVDQFGDSVSGAGDVNADGYADFIVGAYFDDNNGATSGSARVFFSVPLPIPIPCPGDADLSGTVNFSDITAVLTSFNTACP